MWRFKKQTTHRKHETGFTLIEMVVALAIFSLTILVATNIYLLVSNAQQRAFAAQKILDDVRALFETMTQEVRLGMINYAYYERHDIDLHPDAGISPAVLAVVSQSGEQEFFRLNVGTVQYCQELSGTDCDPSGGGWLDVTPAGVTINHLSFTITPSADPFTATSRVACVDDSSCGAADLTSYRCAADSICRYYSNGRSVQPQVLIAITSTARAPRLIQQASISMQTLVTSRIIGGSLANEYHD